MIIHKGYEHLKLINPVVTLGIFDGVHRGHRVLIDYLIEKARLMKGESVVITFTPHPRLVLQKNHGALSFLTTMEEKIQLLGNANIDHLIILEFTKEFSEIGACDFVNDILVNRIGTRHLIIGYNNHFGRRGEGDFNTIKECARLLNFSVEQIHGLYSEEGVVSSSTIREALLMGNLEDANSLLGYHYQLNGTIVEGKKIGRSLGFPTANIKPDSDYKLIPLNGVYAVDVYIDGIKYIGMLSVGSNPTVNVDPSLRSIEVNILDFALDIYGKQISVVFRNRLRDEIRFENKEQLTEQMKIDKQQVLLLLKE